MSPPENRSYALPLQLTAGPEEKCGEGGEPMTSVSLTRRGVNSAGCPRRTRRAAAMLLIAAIQAIRKLRLERAKRMIA